MGKVRWTPSAEEDVQEISTYWTTRNKSTAFSRKLLRILRTAAKDLAANPTIGRSTEIVGVKMKLVHDTYWLIYEIEAEGIAISGVMSTYQHPDTFYKKLQ